MADTTARDVAELTGGRLEGDGDAEVKGINTLENASEGDIAIVREEKFLERASGCGASVLVSPKPVPAFEGTNIIVKDPESALADILEFFYKERCSQPEGISKEAQVASDAELGNGVSVGHNAIIEGGARIGDGVAIAPLAYIGRGVKIGHSTSVSAQACIMSYTVIGESCAVGPHALIGDSGFGFLQREGVSRRLQHLGRVIIGDRVEIGGHTTVDRGMLEDTVIGEGTKIDKHCMVAHNCRIGKNCILAGYTRMAGSVTIGDGAVLAADVRISDHKSVGDKAVIAAGTGVARDIEPGEVVWGEMARPLRKQTRIYAMQGRLPELFKRVRNLEKKLKDMKTSD